MGVNTIETVSLNNTKTYHNLNRINHYAHYIFNSLRLIQKHSYWLQLIYLTHFTQVLLKLRLKYDSTSLLQVDLLVVLLQLS